MLEDVGSNVSQRINDLHIAVIPSRVSRLRPIVRIHRTRAEGTKGLALKGFPRPPPSRPAATSYVRAEPAHTESKGMGARSKVDIMPFPVCAIEQTEQSAEGDGQQRRTVRARHPGHPAPCDREQPSPLPPHQAHEAIEQWTHLLPSESRESVLQSSMPIGRLKHLHTVELTRRSHPTRPTTAGHPQVPAQAGTPAAGPSETTALLQQETRPLQPQWSDATHLSISAKASLWIF